MSAQVLGTTAIVLDRSPSGEHWLRLLCFSREAGNLDCLLRLARRTAANAPALDLFDETQLALETRNQGRTWFVREALPLRRRTALGASYPALRAACRFARVLAQNPVPEESRDEIYALLERALEAWEAGTRPDSVYFKSLYLLAREEGYPVREEWWHELAPTDRAAVESVLRQPAAEQTASEGEVARLIAALEHYLRHHTEIRVSA